MANDVITIAKERQQLKHLMDKDDYKVPNRRIDENLLIATWNIEQFGRTKTSRALQYIADICERFDIIAIQELKSDLSGLSHLQKLLPGNYKILVTDPTGNNERLAFLYDKRTVVHTGLACEICFNVPGSTHRGYQLHRTPFCASFKAGRFDFTIVTVHIYYGEGSAEKAEREKEIKSLATHIITRSKMEGNKIFDRDFFVLGDFNIEQTGDQFFEALSQNGKFIIPKELDNVFTNFDMNKTYDKIAWIKRDSFIFSKN